MFYYLIRPLLVYNWILIVAAVVPAVYLMIKVYKSDRVEKESGGMLLKLMVLGVLSTMLARIEERIGEWVLSIFISENTVLYQVILYFVVVAVSEETSKFILLKRGTWTSPEFDCQYDGVVYSVFVSLGFALWENISYVLSYGFSTAIVRAVTAIPGHACFGVFMGIFYGLAKRYHNIGYYSRAKTCRVLSVIVPVLLHGAYDYIATMGSSRGSLGFIVFILLLFGISLKLVRIASDRDRFI